MIGYHSYVLPWQCSLVEEAWSLLYMYLSKTESWQHYGAVVDRLLAMSIELPQWLVGGMKVHVMPDIRTAAIQSSSMLHNLCNLYYKCHKRYT